MISRQRLQRIQMRAHAKRPFNAVAEAFKGLEVRVLETADLEAQLEMERKVTGLAKLARKKRLEYDAMRTANGTSGEVNRNVIVNGVVRWEPVDKTTALVVSPRPKDC